MKYVLGFLFHAKTGKVALIQKRRPAWMAGKLNGVGGRVEEGETFLAAMERECLEETGATVTNWRLRGIVHHGNVDAHVIRIYSATADVVIRDTTDEHVRWFNPNEPWPQWMPNLRWMLPIVMSKSDEFFHVHDATEPWKDFP